MQSAVGRKDGAQRAKADIRVGQVMEHARTDDLVERPAQVADLFDGKPMEIEVSQVVFLLKVARVAEARFADVDARYARIGLAHRVGRGLRGPTTGDQNFPPCPLSLRRPQQKRERSPSIRVPIELAMLVEAA
jgi:hypothetical protein